MKKSDIEALERAAQVSARYCALQQECENAGLEFTGGLRALLTQLINAPQSAEEENP